MAVTEKVEEVLKKTAEKPADFRQQLEKYKKFKDKMEKAGIKLGDKYEIPLMQRIGYHTPK